MVSYLAYFICRITFFPLHDSVEFYPKYLESNNLFQSDDIDGISEIKLVFAMINVVTGAIGERS